MTISTWQQVGFSGKDREMRSHQDASDEILGRLRLICLALPEATEQRAWVGTRWCIKKRNFAHVVPIDDGWPPTYARAVGSDGPITIVTFRVSLEEHAALRAAGHPYVVSAGSHEIARAVGGRDRVGLIIDHDTDWSELTELITDSYRLVATKALRAQLD